MKTFFSSFSLFIVLISNAQTYNSPESVEFDAARQRYIVSNTLGNNLQSVIPGSAPTLLISNVPAPYGIAIVGDTVYVCCNSSHLRGYNLTTGLQVFDANLGGGFLNGICTDFSGNIFVTDFFDKKIVRYNIATQQFNYIVGAAMAKQPNGIVYDSFHNRLAIATWGTNAPILGLSLTDSTIITLKATALANIDGLTIDEDGNFYAADWGSDGIYFFDSGFVNDPIKVVTGLANPADISYNAFNDTIAVPNTNGNSVQFFGFPRPVPTTDFDTVTVLYSQAICVLQNDFISSNAVLILQSISSPRLGSATVSGNCINYRALSEGSDTIIYIVCTVDTPSFCKTGFLFITNVIDTSNHAPVAMDDTVSIIQFSSINVNVVSNDLDAISDTLCITSIIGSSSFSLDTSSCTNIIFSPDSFFVGVDTCWYVVCDNGTNALCDTAVLVVTVNACFPQFDLTFYCNHGFGGSGPCIFYANALVHGINSDSILWHVTDIPNQLIDTILINDDTLSIGPYGPLIDLSLDNGHILEICATAPTFCGTATICDTIEILWSGIEEIFPANISIFPNPANKILTIDMQSNNEEITRNYSSIEILNVLGEKQESVYKNGASKIITLDIGDLPNGIYLATIVSDNRERRMLGKFTISR